MCTYRKSRKGQWPSLETLYPKILSSFSYSHTDAGKSLHGSLQLSLPLLWPSGSHIA